MTDWIVRTLLARRNLLLGSLAVTALASAAISAGLKFDFTPQAVFRGSDDLVAFSEDFKSTFGYEDSILMVVITATGSEDVLSSELLNWQIKFEEAVGTISAVDNLVSLPTLKVPYRSLLARRGITMVPIARKVPVDGAESQRIREAVDYYGSFDNYLLSEDRRMATILLELDPAKRDIEGLREVVGRVREILKQNTLPAGYQTSLCGLPALRVQVVEDLERGQLWMVPLAGVVGLAVLAIGFRSLSGTLLPMLAVGVGLAWTIAAMVLTGESLGIINNILPVLLIAIGISNCVHFVSRYAEESRLAPNDRTQAVAATLRGMIPACLLTYGTTAVGFLSLTVARSEALQELGWQASIGLALLFLSTIAVLGGLMPWFQAPQRNASAGSGLQNILTKSFELVARHPRKVLIVTCSLLIVACLAAKGMHVNSRVMEAYSDEHPFSKQMQAVEENMSGYLSLEIDLSTEDPSLFDSPKVIRELISLEDQIASCEGVLQVASFVDIYSKAFAHFRNQPRQRVEFPAEDDPARERLSLCNRILSVAGDGSLQRFLSDDRKRARVMIRVRDIGTHRTLALMSKIEQLLAERFPSGSQIHHRITGEAYLMAVAMDRFVRDLFVSLGGATVVVFALMTLLFRSIRYGLITVPPNVTPLVLTLGYMAWRGYDMNIAHVIVFAISLGVAVDDTIHFVSRFREELKFGRNAATAVRNTLASTGRAIVFTTLVMLAGLAVLSTSHFMPTRHFAELMAITMASALVGDLILLPACLLLFGGVRS